MEKDLNKKIIYSINIEDVQTVAQQEIERNLTLDEISKLEDSITENIDWYGAIADAINNNYDIDQSIS